MKLENGRAGDMERGSGILNEGRLILQDATMTGHSFSASPSSGSAVANLGFVEITGGLYTNNTAMEGAVIYNGAEGEAIVRGAQIRDNGDGVARSVIHSDGGRIVVTSTGCRLIQPVTA